MADSDVALKEEIIALKEKLSNGSEIGLNTVDNLNRLALLQLKAEPAAAEETAKRAIGEAKKIHYHEGEALAYMQAGMAASARRDYEIALHEYKFALLLFEQLADKPNIAQVHAKMGNAYLHHSKYTDALEHYKQGIAIREEINDDAGAADLYSNSGVIHGFMGNYPLAIAAHMHALKTFERLNQPQRIASTSTNMGSIFREQQNYADALKMFDRALEIYQNLDDTKMVSSQLVNIGNVYEEQGKLDEAIEVRYQALKLAESIDDKVQMALCYLNLGSSYKKNYKYLLARDYFQRALEIYRKLNDQRRLVVAYIDIGELSYQMADYGTAHKYLREALTLAESMGLKSELRKTFEYLSQLYAHERRYEEAYKSHLSYMQLDKEISNAEISRQIAQMNFKYEIEQKEREAELERIKHTELQKAFDSLEKERRRSDELLNNILPEEVSRELKESGKTKARSYEIASVMFADIQGFTKISEQLSAEEIVSGIDEYFEAFDRIVEKYGIEKIKTIGDAYLCVAGIPLADAAHAEKIVQAARDFLQASAKLKSRREANGQRTFDFRIGIHSGPVVAGVVGIKKFAYDIWGDTVNTASRIQQYGEPNRINLSHSTYSLIKEKFVCEFRGEIDAKNKGKLKMYFVATI